MGIVLAFRWMEKDYGHHVAASLPAESDTGLSAKKIMEEGNLPTFTLQEVNQHSIPTPAFVNVRYCGLYCSAELTELHKGRLALS